MDEICSRYLETLERMERAPPSELNEYQTRLAEHVVRYAAEKLPFYAERLRPVFRGEVFRGECWADIPILTRSEIQTAASEMVVDDPSQPGWVVDCSSSGSTGIPLSFRWTWLADAANQAMMMRLYRWHGFDPNGVFAFIKAYKDSRAAWPEGFATGQWSPAGPAGTSSRLTIATPLDRQIEWLRRIRPKYLWTYPSNLDAMADAIGVADHNLNIEAVVTTGEILKPETRRRVADAFGARVVDGYACQELGMVAVECPQSGLMHVCAENLIVEVLDESGAAVPPGGIGRVVGTGFYNLATPFIRYALGDFAQTARAPCPCGRTLPALERVLGRQRNMFVFADGTRIWPLPGLWRLSLSDILPVKQVQAVQTALDQVELRYIPTDPDYCPDPDTVRTRMRGFLPPTVNFVLVPVTHIPYGAGGKFEDCISLVSSAARG